MEGASQLPGGLVKFPETGGQGRPLLQAYQARHRQGKPETGSVLPHHGKASLALPEGIDGLGHGLGRSAHHAEIMAVVAHAGRQSPGLEAKAPHQSPAHIPVLSVAFHHGHGEHIGGVGGQGEAFRQQGAIGHPHDGAGPSVPRQKGEILRGHEAAPDSMEEGFLRGEVGIFLHLIQLFPGNSSHEDPLDAAVFQIGKKENIPPLSRSNESPVRQAQSPGGGNAGHPIGHQGRDARLDGPAHHGIQMAPLLHVQGTAVVGAEGQLAGVLQSQQGQKGLQIPGGASLPDQHLEPPA